jgi:hypothetical protein
MPFVCMHQHEAGDKPRCRARQGEGQISAVGWSTMTHRTGGGRRTVTRVELDNRAETTVEWGA